MAKIRGRDKLRFVLKKLPETTRAEIKKVIVSGAELIKESQQRLVPWRTGALHDSIIVTPGNQDPPRYATLRSRKTQFPDPELSAIITAGNSGVRYAHLVEFGSSAHTNEGRFPGTQNPGAPPRPYFYPGFRARRKEVQNKINKAARAGIKKGLK